MILYQDADLLVVNKPAGLLFHTTDDPTRPSLVGTLQREHAYLGTHQRLDQGTSGVVLFSLNREVNPALAQQFEGRQVVKVYHALTVRARLPATQWSVSRALAREGARTVERADGQSAQTDFQLLRRLPEALLVEARPRTGRRHQIRVHLAGGGLPIVGDVLYGGPPASRVMLHARRLELAHPRTGAPLVVEAEYPEDFGGWVG